VVREVLDGRDGPDREVVVLNSAAGIIAAGLASEFPEGVAMAKESLDSGRARTALKRLIEVSTA
jgi:anthranilate phosphoribosyltransferase